MNGGGARYLFFKNTASVDTGGIFYEFEHTRYRIHYKEEYRI
jgi:hypothetical protein